MARPRVTTEAYQTVTIRIPKSLMECCHEDARKHERSLNFTIVAILRQWYARPMPASDGIPERHPGRANGSMFRNTKSEYLGALCDHEPVSHQYERSGQSVRQRKDDQCRLCAIKATQAAQGQKR